jgi:hypothetical protein
MTTTTAQLAGGRREWTVQILTYVLFAAGIVAAGLLLTPSKAWIVVLGATVTWFLAVGYQAKSYFFGILIDERNRLSLSRAQLVVWSAVVLSAFAAAALINVGRDVKDPLRIGVPREIWLLLGISITSLVGSPLLLSSSRKKPGATELATKPSARDASLLDLVKGEGAENSDYVDLPRLQMGFFTLVIVVCYCAALGDLFTGIGERGAIRELPGLDAGLLALMGISHTGYLASKPLAAGEQATTKGKKESRSDSDGGDG